MQADGFPESQGVESQAQPDTQSTQQASQVFNTAVDSHLWGYLQPCNAVQARIDFWRINQCYRIGRNQQGNEIVLPGFKVSEYLFLPRVVQLAFGWFCGDEFIA
jgi:serine/threonine/tyrosine protein kinase RAD53